MLGDIGDVLFGESTIRELKDIERVLREAQNETEKVSVLSKFYQIERTEISGLKRLSKSFYFPSLL